MKHNYKKAGMNTNVIVKSNILETFVSSQRGGGGTRGSIQTPPPPNIKKALV
jgi:hypothetical protein